MAAQLGLNLSEAQQQRVLQLNELDEIRENALQHTILVQEQMTKWHDKSIKKKQFKQGDWALLFYYRFKDFKGKLTTGWLGPYEVETKFENGVVRIKNLDEQPISFIVNGHRLRVYTKPLSKEEFIQNILQQSEMEIVDRDISSLTDPT